LTLQNTLPKFFWEIFEKENEMDLLGLVAFEKDLNKTFKEIFEKNDPNLLDSFLERWGAIRIWKKEMKKWEESGQYTVINLKGFPKFALAIPIEHEYLPPGIEPSDIPKFQKEFKEALMRKVEKGSEIPFFEFLDKWNATKVSKERMEIFRRSSRYIIVDILDADYSLIIPAAKGQEIFTIEIKVILED
jgi:hypothetical protein